MIVHTIHLRLKHGIIAACCAAALVLGLCLYNIPASGASGPPPEGAVQVPIIMYHGLLKETKRTGAYVVTPETFEKDLQYLKEKGYTLKDTYNMGYASDPKTWDALATSRSADSEAIVNTYDGLVEYDNENEIKPALAESWEVSEDGKTYTFHIRQGAKWVDAQGREVADVKADDFVAGMQHMLDAGGGLEYLVENIIVNALEYNKGDVTDFAEVGVKATDDNTVVYTLCQPTSYFITMLGYNVFAPMSRTYFESKGGVFGKDDYKTAVDAGTVKYGQTVNDIAYCGPYTVTNHTANNIQINFLLINKSPFIPSIRPKAKYP